MLGARRVGEVARSGRAGRAGVTGPRARVATGIDRADRKQAAALTDHDSRVLARRRVVCRAWQLGPLLDWVLEQALAVGDQEIPQR